MEPRDHDILIEVHTMCKTEFPRIHDEMQKFKEDHRGEIKHIYTKIGTQSESCCKRFVKMEDKVSSLENWRNYLGGILVIVGGLASSLWAKIVWWK